MSSSRINVSSSLSPEPQTVGTKTNKQDHGIQKKCQANASAGADRASLEISTALNSPELISTSCLETSKYCKSEMSLKRTRRNDLGRGLDLSIQCPASSRRKSCRLLQT